MSAALASLIYSYGLPLVFVTAYASCLGIPVPASLIFMVAGSFAASGDFDPILLWLSGYAGAVSGDQSGYLIARFASQGVSKLFQNSGIWQTGIQKAREFSEKWGNLSIFFSRWLFSPLGPWINFSNGLTRYSWQRFTLWGMLGETVWVSLHLGVGYSFSTQAQEIADLLGNAIWLILAAGLTLWLGLKLWQRSKQNLTG